MSKKISQLQTSSGTDDTTFIPIIMGEPKVNRKISSKNLISPTDDPINEIISDLSDLAYTKDLDIESDVIGYLEYNSPAPTPNENGKFETSYLTPYGAVELRCETDCCKFEYDRKVQRGSLTIDYRLFTGDEILGEYKIRLQFAA